MALSQLIRQAFTAPAPRDPPAKPRPAPVSGELTLPSVLFVEAREEQRCRDHLLSGKPVTLTGLTPSGRRRQLTGVISGMHRGSVLHPGHPLMLTIRERIDLA